MGIWKSLKGILQVELTSASPAEMITAVSRQGISLYNVAYISELTVVGCVRRDDYRFLCAFLERRGESVKVKNKHGVYWPLQKLAQRPVLLLGMLLFLLLATYLPTRVLFIDVEGNQIVSKQLILEMADKCGISFGTARRDVRSERVKNSLLAAIPELQWAGVNTSGCTAVISVKERTQTETSTPDGGVSSIVAARDGVISYRSVLQGNPLCRVGEAVKKGQVLVSGYTDCGTIIQATHAQAEIYAQTLRTVSAITPADCSVRGDPVRTDVQYSLLVGKKLIKLSQDSGISDSGCVRMYKRYTLTLPGGFQLPISLIQEQFIYYDHGISATGTDGGFTWMQGYAEEYLQSQMIAGQILQSNISAELQGDVYKLVGEYSCIEMIGETQKEEIIEHDGKTD